jgi:hypothetical protein
MIRYALFAGLTLMVCVPALHADQLWDWSYTGSQWSGSGTFDTESNLTTGVSGFTGYRIVDISGTWNSEPITLLLPLAGFQSNDNLLAVSTPQLSLNGVAFNNTDTSYNISYSGSLNNYTATSANPFITDDGRGTFSATEVVPEPRTTVLIGSSLCLFALLLRRNRSEGPIDHPSV